MKNNLQTKKLGDISKINLGLTHTPKYVDNGIPFLSVKDITKGYINFSNTKFITREEFDSMPNGAKPRKGDVLFCRVGTLGYPQIINDEKEFGIFVSLGFFRVKEELVFNRYLAYWMYSPMFYSQINENVQGSTLKNLNTGWLKNFNIFLPSINEQRRIVKVLDEVFEKIEKAKINAEKNLQNSRELFDSYLNIVFANHDNNWEICTIDKHINFIDYRGRTPKKTNKGLKLITAKNVKQGFLQNTPEEFVDPKIYDSWMTRGIPKKGDVLFTTEAPLANVAQLDTDEKVVFAQRIIILQPDINHLDQKFLKYLLLSAPIRKKIIEKGTGATVQGIKAKLLKKIEIYFPKSLFEQKEIVKKLDELSEQTKKMEEIYKKKIACLEELKMSVLNKAFAGEL